MTKERALNHSSFAARFLVAGALLATVGLTACGDAETREDLEGERLFDEPRTEEAMTEEDWTRERAEPAGAVIPAGETLIFEVAETVSTDGNEEGDTFTLRLVSDVQGTNGARLPEGTEARGVVALAEESTGPEDEAALVVAVETVHVNGDAVPLIGEVESATTETATRDSGARTAAKIATGAAAGAVIGQVLGGDTRSTLQGALAGGVAGVGVAITTRDGHAVLPEGSRVTVRLEEPLPVSD
jgi:hypothetical protein